MVRPPGMLDAIGREKRIKRWRRDGKLALIEAANPPWRDLSDGWFEVAEARYRGCSDGFEAGAAGSRLSAALRPG